MITSRDLDNRDAGGGPAPGLPGPLVSPSTLATHWGVHVHTVYRDIGKGALRAFKLPSGRIRVRAIDADRYGRPIE